MVQYGCVCDSGDLYLRQLGPQHTQRPGLWGIDASLFRRFPFLESRAIEFREPCDLSDPSADISQPNFGVITSTQNNSRIIQFGAKIVF
jgi:hypothetical protein